ncbi:MAG: ferredoxin-type protein NapF [Rhodocyclaceae bacterium]|nr:ferredoxin-type protein NapF [Rhodocyclaceae bacterium]
MISRRQFLRGDIAGSKAPLRPPWALPEAQFIDACNRCGACVPACPEKIIVVQRGYPAIDFSRGACTFCAGCLKACIPGALKETAGEPPWRVLPRIARNCIANDNAVCRACGDACAATAIRFRPRLGGAARPEVDGAKCTGCGACVAPCPVTAITLA